MERLFMSVIGAGLNHTRVVELQYSVSFAKNHDKDIVDYILSSQYLLRQSHLSYVRYVTLGRVMTNNADVPSLLEWLNKNVKDGKELGILHIDREVLRATGARFAVILIEAAETYTNNATRSTAFHTTSVCRLGEQFRNRCAACT